MLKDISPEWSHDFHIPVPRMPQTRRQDTEGLCQEGDAIGLDRQTLVRNRVGAFEHGDVRARSFMLLRSQLMGRFYNPGGRILAVTSAMPREGKTFLAANVAAALSRIHPTVVIDLDLRRPALAQRFGITPQCGMDDVLAGRAKWSESGHKPVSGLTIHGVREAVTDPAELLASDRLQHIFRDVRQLPGGPLCIVDTPPILMLDDTNLIARHVDGLLMVIDEGRTRASNLRKAMASLAPATIIGSVLNRSLSISRSDVDYAYYEYHQAKS